MNTTENYDNELEVVHELEVLHELIDELWVVGKLVHELTKDLDNKSEIELKPTDNGYIITRYTSGMGSGYRVHQLYGLSESEMLFVVRDYLEIMIDRCHARSKEDE